MAADGAAAAAEASPPRFPLSRIYEQREETMVFPHDLQQWPSKVFFKGWKIPQGKWDEWVDRLAGKYCSIWNQSGICDASLSSRYEIRGNNKNVLLGLAEFWSPETNTLVFPWGEATITLEDVMVLGRFSALGRNVTRPVTGLLAEIVEEMEKKRMEISRTKAKKACQSRWIKNLMELPNGGYEYEHVAFLSLWLSRSGKRVALAPAVLSGLFRDLSLLKKRVLSGEAEISVTGPFQLMQLWAFERFPPLIQSPLKTPKPGEPRAARCHKVASKSIGLPLVRTVFKLQENFQWRPFAADLSNLRHSSYYKENKPFGMDQDLPGEFPGLDFAASGNDVGFFVLPWSFEPSVTARRFKRFSASVRERKLQMTKECAQTLTKSKPEKNHTYVMPEVSRKSNTTSETQTSAIPPKQVKKELPADHTHDDDDIPLSEQMNRQFPRKVENESAPDHSDDSNEDSLISSVTKGEGFPAKKRSAVDFSKSLTKIATKGKKAGEGTNVQVDVPSRVGDKHKVATKPDDSMASVEILTRVANLEKLLGVNSKEKQNP
ncbi:serine/threonine-protein phosphatase 7 long form-like protein [Pyrus ussuriensis x Pyrus communis]|uniref:Serine/threonine-protein phosphatase 7 long form-like protein n=1 Tax=Pyrus ussuriensis x Pyrus communis TaxID=2448454 RepID=A0A5N5GY48_9ROSA|nr:serine/threonine-protein phosphatase 7 long form-like protein [Pyrus ussuriensis x Pyrus communis]